MRKRGINTSSWLLALILALATATLPPTPARAAGGTKDRDAALRLRHAIEQKSLPTPPERIAEKYLLPVTRGFNQRLSQLCWAYATLNALETLHLVQNPGTPLLLSRGYLQHTTWQDRLERRLSDPKAKLSDRGTAMNGLLLVQEKGVAQLSDYSDTSSKYSPNTDAILEHVASLPNLLEKFATIASDLGAFYGKLPTVTRVQQETLTTRELSRRLLGNERWVSYAVTSATHPAGWGADPDPDGRGDYQVLFTSLEDIRSKIYLSLKRGAPVMLSNLAHLVLIYGADYDHQGNALTFYIKDSYPGYFYQAEPSALYGELLEITTIAN